MKPIKMLGLVVLTALMAMALVGASSAMAESTALCKADESPCSAANEITHVHETTSTKAKLLGENEIECTVLFLGDRGYSTEELGLVLVGAFTYSSCTSSCTVKEENGPAIIQVLKSGTELASSTGKGLVHIKCFFGLIDCSYTGKGLEGHALGPLNGGGTNGNVTLTGQETKKESSSAACDPEAFLDITTSPLVATYISAPPATGHYCVGVEHELGFYFGSEESECIKEGENPQGSYELVLGPAGTAVQTMVCVFFGRGALYKHTVDNEKCKEDAPINNGIWELGTIQ